MTYYEPDPDDWNPMEAERPCCFKEFVGPDECWEQIGMRIRWTNPEVPGEHFPSVDTWVQESPMFDPLLLRLCLECKKPVPIHQVSVFAWTHVFHEDNQEGIYREIQLIYDENSRKWDDQGVTCYEFQAQIYPTHSDEFRLTFNVKYGEYMIWANKFRTDNTLTIKAIRPGSDLMDKSQQTRITKKIFIGNYLSVLLSDEMNYDCLLNLDQLTEEQLKMFRMRTAKVDVIRACREVNAGAGNPIPEEKVGKIVAWLKKNNQKRTKILVGDRVGLGRVGSALTAYIYANNPNLTFEEAYDYVRRRKSFVFCHKGLRDAVTKLFPRD